MALRRFEVAVEGASPLLLSNNRISDPLSEGAKLKKHFTSKHKKADEDHENLRVLDWLYSGYWETPGTVDIDDAENTLSVTGFENLYMPDQNFARCLRNGAAAFRLGKETTRALQVENSPIIEHNGPSTAEEMLSDSRFINTSPVVRQKVTNWVTRIVLPTWSCLYRVFIDDERISVDDFYRIVKTSGQFEGLGTWRPRFGRFTAEITEIEFA